MHGLQMLAHSHKAASKWIGSDVVRAGSDGGRAPQAGLKERMMMYSRTECNFDIEIKMATVACIFLSAFASNANFQPVACSRSEIRI